LFEAVEVKRKEGVLVPRKYADYEVTINKEGIPQEVELIVKE
jgi:CRISPR-associated protein Csd2